MNMEYARFNMIEQQIRPWDVLDQDVLSLLALVKREDFVPPAYASLAFVDTEVPLPGRRGEQSMLAPKVEARLLQELALRRHERVLEVGTGSGYMAALLGHRSQEVISFEIDEDLADFARRNLDACRIEQCPGGRRRRRRWNGRGGAVRRHRAVGFGSCGAASAAVAVASWRPTGGDRRRPADHARPAFHPKQWRRRLRQRRSVRHRGTAAERLCRAESLRFLMRELQVGELAALAAQASADGTPLVLLDVREAWELELAALQLPGFDAAPLAAVGACGRSGPDRPTRSASAGRLCLPPRRAQCAGRGLSATPRFCRGLQPARRHRRLVDRGGPACPALLRHRARPAAPPSFPFECPS